MPSATRTAGGPTIKAILVASDRRARDNVLPPQGFWDATPQKQGRQSCETAIVFAVPQAMQQSRILRELDVGHGFSTALAGDAKDPQVRSRLLQDARIKAPLATARQVPGRTGGWRPGDGPEPEADALLARRGQAVGIFTADCVPILLVDPE